MKDVIDKKQQPFLYVIENIDKVNIDDVLKPTFKEVLKLLQNYFEKNNLLDVKDYSKFFDDFLIGEGKSAIQFIPSSTTKRHNNYNVNTKNIEIIDWSNEFGTSYEMNQNSIHNMLHEFIHFLVHRQPMNDKKINDYKLAFLNEGFTENLTEEIMGIQRNDTYKDNIDVVDLIKSLNGKKESYKMFLQGYDLNQKILNNNEGYINDVTYLHVFANNPELINTPISNSEKKSLIYKYRLKVQRDLIESFPVEQCRNIHEFIQIVKNLSQRQLLDKKFMKSYYDNYKALLLKEYKQKRDIPKDEEQKILGELDKIINTIESFDRYNCEDLCRLTLGDDRNSVEVCIDKNGKILREKQFEKDGQIVDGFYNNYSNEYVYSFSKEINNERITKKLKITPEEFSKLDFTKAKNENKKDMDNLLAFFEKYERESQIENPVVYTHDINQLYDDISKEIISSEDFETSRNEKIEKSNEVLTNGLEGNLKELAEIFGEILVNESVSYNKFADSRVNVEMQLGEKVELPKEIIKRDDNSFIIVYKNENGDKVGIPCKRDELGKLQIKGDDGVIVNSDEIERVEKILSKDEIITFEQMEMQVVKNNIEKTLTNENVNEIIEIKDDKMKKYLNEQNNLSKYNIENEEAKIFMILIEDNDGNNHYEFVAHNNSHEYTKLEGIQQIENNQKSIITEGSRVPNQPTLMQKVDCTFMDKNGNTYYSYHDIAQGLSMAYSEPGKEALDKKVVSEDYGINNLNYNSKVKSLFKAGYNAMGIGYEKVKSIYRQFKTKDKEKEVETENTRED